jgi:hypothetical protein
MAAQFDLRPGRVNLGRSARQNDMKQAIEAHP